ncbi:hypothetical protein [Amycolatopsis sp. DG1A-15b]|uniref:hypothetical protein n=1 Tax=Amycolatopsis sp. DG1A-15b TaxID=3052846 RepID=UPI00255BD22A|nr:hypothetical protein [Amycolatopsis sp. DG1A-15b]WIX88165.1 hypothetical protein QRY02_44790 [Amycolatopsis sp. DG1A-15b]
MPWRDWTGRWWQRRGDPFRGCPAEPVTDPVHHTILALTIDGFSAPERTTMHRLALRAGLYRVAEQALSAGGVEWEDCYRADLGDGVLILAPAGYPKAVFSELVPAELTASLAVHNASRSRPERIRLRAALHAGEVSYDVHGTTGAAIVHAFRLLRSGVLEDAVACAGGELAMIASAWFYDEIIRHSPASRPDRFRQVLVREKETAARGWVRLLGPGEGTRDGRMGDLALGG